LIDHLDGRPGLLAKVAYLVLDEADRMLDMGFAPQLNRIASFLPPARQTLLFSATVPTDILKLAGRFMKGDPKRVSVAPLTAAERPKINEKTIEVGADGKNQALLDALAEREGSVIVFARTQVRTERAAKFLKKSGVPAESIHGGLSQGQRRRALDAFRDGSIRVLVATDIAARGIDVPHVAHVINFDLPSQPEDYVHRIGRTGRAGREGEALTLLTSEDRVGWKAIERLRGGGGNSHTSSPRGGGPRGGAGGGGGGGGRFQSRGGARGGPSAGGGQGGEGRSERREPSEGRRASHGERPQHGARSEGRHAGEGRPAAGGGGGGHGRGAGQSHGSHGPRREGGARAERAPGASHERSHRPAHAEGSRPAGPRPAGPRPAGGGGRPSSGASRPASGGKPSWSERLFGRKKS
jgi:ATP-dependent RNA helicase RhlE